MALDIFSHRFRSPSGISSRSRSRRCCSEIDQASLYVSGLGVEITLGASTFSFFGFVLGFGLRGWRVVFFETRFRLLEGGDADRSWCCRSTSFVDGRRVRMALVRAMGGYVIVEAGLRERVGVGVATVVLSSASIRESACVGPSSEISTSPLSSSKSLRTNTPDGPLALLYPKPDKGMVNPPQLIIFRFFSARILACSRSLFASSVALVFVLFSSSSSSSSESSSCGNASIRASKGSIICRLDSLTNF